MSPAFTRQQAADAVTKARGERDTIRANLFDLDGSFGKRPLAGAALTGTTRQRWDSAADSLAALWELSTAPCDLTAVEDAVHCYQQAVLATGARRS
jgi:hypothetical protein